MLPNIENRFLDYFPLQNQTPGFHFPYKNSFFSAFILHSEFKSLISERKKPCGPKMIVLVRIPQAQNSGAKQPTSKVNGQTSNMATGTELVDLGDSYFFESATFIIPFPHSDLDSEH